MSVSTAEMTRLHPEWPKAGKPRRRSNCPKLRRQAAAHRGDPAEDRAPAEPRHHSADRAERRRRAGHRAQAKRHRSPIVHPPWPNRDRQSPTMLARRRPDIAIPRAHKPLRQSTTHHKTRPHLVRTAHQIRKTPPRSEATLRTPRSCPPKSKPAWPIAIEAIKRPVDRRLRPTLPAPPFLPAWMRPNAS